MDEEKKIPMCPKCKKYQMMKTNYQEYFCSKCGCLAMPEWITRQEFLTMASTGLAGKPLAG
jgi:ribosomal protein L37AE/L43A